MNNPAQTGVQFLVMKCILLGLIDKTYQLENLYRNGDMAHGNEVLGSLRAGLMEISDDLGNADSVLNIPLI